MTDQPSTDTPLPPPGRTSFDAMVLAADAELRDSEAGLRSWLEQGEAGAQWVAYYTERRNAFAGLLRLIDKIRSDESIYEKVMSR